MKTQEEPLFLHAPFFMVRTPILPIESFFSLMEKENGSEALLKIFQTDPLIREAIAIASPTLYQAIINQKEDKQIISSLLKYFSRMTSRSTPYGLFSFVSLGSFGQSSNLFYDLSKIRKRARPDMEWLSKVIDTICSDPIHLMNLSVRTNPLAYTSGMRIFLNYLRKDQKEDKPKTVSIRKNFLTEAIFELAKKEITVRDLVNQIVEAQPSFVNEKVVGVIKQLLEQQYLCFTLVPSLMTESPFENLLSKLALLQIQHDRLMMINDKIKNYNTSLPGKGEEDLKLIEQEMEKLAISKNMIQVDTTYEGTPIILPEAIAIDLEEYAEVLWRLSSAKPKHNPLGSYHKKFIEKYGMHRTVPLQELLGEVSGLGIPTAYLPSGREDQNQKDEKGGKWEKWLKQQWLYCIREKKFEIEVTEEVLEKTIEKEDKKKALLSFDLFCEIIAASPSQIDEGNYLLYLPSFSWQAGATFGRFLDLFGGTAKTALHTLYCNEEALEEKNQFAEASFFPESSRLANVAIQPNLRKAAIDLGGEGSISLDDIVVGATSERLYLKLNQRPDELIVTTGNMLNSKLAPIPIRFIRDISTTRYHLLHSFPWMSLEGSLFLPRVRYKRAIISPAQWKVDLFQLGLSEKATLESIEINLKAWAKLWDLPRYCFMGHRDQRFLIDLENPNLLREVVLQVKKGPVLLIEKIGQEEGQWIRSSQGHHLSEFVIPFIKNSKYHEAPKPSIYPQMHPITIYDRWKIPGSEWLYAKCYVDSEQENRFLIDHCSRFIDFLKQHQIITEWFFVRYTDEKPHVRLRFRGERQRMISQLIPAVHDWSHQLMNDHAMREITLSSYERETERYGGEALIEAAEELFHGDSITSIALINAMAGKKLSIPEEVVAAVSLINMLKNFGMDHEAQMKFFSTANLDKNELKGFREHKNILINLTEAILQDRLDSHSEDARILNGLLILREKSVKRFAEKMQAVETGQGLSNSPSMVLNSILHMHCNRLLGRDKKKENKARLFAYHTLSVIANKAKARG